MQRIASSQPLDSQNRWVKITTRHWGSTRMQVMMKLRRRKLKLQLSRNQSQHEVSTVEDNSVQRRWSESQFDGDHPPLAEVSVEDDARVNSEPRPGPGAVLTCAASGARGAVAGECPVMALTAPALVTRAAQPRVHTRHRHQVPDVDCHIVTRHESSVRVLMMVTSVLVAYVTLFYSLGTLGIIVTVNRV